MKAILLLLTALSFSLIYSQCNCCTDQYNQFDFWVGEWEVYDTTGNKVGDNSIVELEGGCILSEHWRSVKGGSGRSYNFYNSSDSTWNQTWIDSQGGNLILKGQAGTDQMKLASAPFQKNGNQLQHQITWTKQEDGSVEQRWDVLDEEGNIKNTLFLGIYKRKEG
ncbi:MAG: hypothetical protein KDC84_01600 [Crocinitomicaceae bacterium]|nr:hypothetical protein [Crocinitomicaceae bacterium]